MTRIEVQQQVKYRDEYIIVVMGTSVIFALIRIIGDNQVDCQQKKMDYLLDPFYNINNDNYWTKKTI